MEIASLAYRLGCVNVQWQTPVWNERAIRFYQRLGGEGKEKVRFVFGGEAKDPFLPSERETPNVTMHQLIQEIKNFPREIRDMRVSPQVSPE